MTLTAVHILLDENVPWETVDWMRATFPDVQVSHVVKLFPGATDREISQWANQNHAVIVTYDSDFGDLRYFPLGSHFGIVRLRVWPTNVDNTIDALERVSSVIPWQQLSGALVIVDAQKVRIRKR